MSWAAQASADSHTARALPNLKTAPATLHYLRDGDVVLYRRPRSAVWQCRYRLLARGWVRVSTQQRNWVDAAARACELYDEARFRERNGLSAVQRRFSDIAAATVDALRAELQAGTGRQIYHDYITVIQRSFLPFFGEQYYERIDHARVSEYERWRNERIGRAPAASTLLTYSAAWQRIQELALARGWVSATALIPRLSVRGRATVARPAFSADEVQRLRALLPAWSQGARRSGKEQELRLLLRDYVELLLLTGMRHGTESMRLEWQHCEWYQDAAGQRYLRLRVSGKTGARWLIAKHEAVEVLTRMAARDSACIGLTLDAVIAQRLADRVFRFSTGEQPYHFNAVFRRFLIDAALLKDSLGQVRTLYSLRHTYATQELLAGTDIHTLARQMGTSVVMLERHYSKLTATLAAGQLAR